jgi:Uma2 family endonuclease
MSTTIENGYTAEDLLTMRDGDLYELVDGQLVERDMGTKSNWIAGQLFGLVAAHAQRNGLGWVFPTDNSYQCFPNHPNRVRKPVVSFIRLGRLPNEELPIGHCRIAPDLVAEVVSPNDLFSEVHRKVLEFLAAGVPLVWVVDLDSRTLLVYRADGTLSLLREEDQLSGEPVLNEFACLVSQLFPVSPLAANSTGIES